MKIIAVKVKQNSRQSETQGIKIFQTGWKLPSKNASYQVENCQVKRCPVHNESGTFFKRSKIKPLYTNLYKLTNLKLKNSADIVYK